MKICNRCKKQNQDYAKFCDHCGKSFSSSSISTNIAIIGGIAVVSIIFICIILFLTTGAFFLLTNTNKTTARKVTNPIIIQKPADAPLPVNTTQSDDIMQRISVSTPEPTYTPLPTYTPFPTYTVLPNYVAPSILNVPSAILPTLSPMLNTSKTDSEFKEYLKSKYSTIAGQKLDIDEIRIYNESGQISLKSVDIELTRDSALHVFGEQTKANALAYGTSLLKDTVDYFNRQDCSAYVSYSFHTKELEDYYFTDDWYYVGDNYDIDDGWFVSKDYVKAYLIKGSDEVEVWNYK